MAPKTQPPAVYDRESNAPTVCKGLDCLGTHIKSNSHIVYKSDTFDVHVLTIECILKQGDNIMTNSVASREAFGPSENFARVEGGLFNGERKRETEVDHASVGWIGGIWGRVGD